ncbi:hypothetical protein KLP40_16705 [Hymenobacter sp. NST-14]|uniref:hypothetical protein n=1 Tax=Hymenobacter piscis TaxID=2839984 RepID=UPI001C026F82|nr:hypothetical protein [Hymenobacter piscis]MBT9394809.1 hypothetical protein [Hymenobacter piscis]
MQPNYTLVTTEAEWLAHMVAPVSGLPSLALHVRGTTQLCDWASTYWKAHGGDVQLCESPRKALHRICPALTPEQGKELMAELTALSTLPVELTVTTVLGVLYPSFPAWEGPNEEGGAASWFGFAAKWLLWRSNHSFNWSASHRALVEKAIGSWTTGSQAALLPVDETGAQQVLAAWLGIQPLATMDLPVQQALAVAPEFPLAVPTAWLNVANQEFGKQLLALAAGLASDLAPSVLAWWQAQQDHPQPAAIQQASVNVLLKFLPQHPQALSERILELLVRQASRTALDRLRPLVPAPVPPPMPTTPAEVLQWTTKHYLPYRRWQALAKETTAAVHVDNAARAFGNWFLDHYHELLGTSYPYQQLHWAQHANEPDPQTVTLWVIADGLGWLDAHRLQTYLLQECQEELVLNAATPCFGLVPSITHFTKNSVRWGLSPALALSEALPEPKHPDVGANRDFSAITEFAQPGDLLVWRPIDPDHAYHVSGDEAFVRNGADHALRGLASNIANAVRAISPDVPLRLLLTTDHGRMLGASERTLPVPAGCSASGRAAYAAPGAPRPAPDSDDIRWLAPDLYSLPGWVGVALSDAAFKVPLKKEGSARGGTELFPHGGVWPEEVVVPWFEFGRAEAEAPLITATLSGAAPAGRSGIATLELLNPSVRTLTLRELHVRLGNKQTQILPLAGSCPGLQTLSVSVQLPDWPDSAQLQTAQAKVLLQTTDLQEHTCSVGLNLRNTGLQDRTDDILADLF